MLVKVSKTRKAIVNTELRDRGFIKKQDARRNAMFEYGAHRGEHHAVDEHGAMDMQGMECNMSRRTIIHVNVYLVKKRTA